MTAKAAVTLYFFISVSLFTLGCRRYDTFTLPVLPNASAARQPFFQLDPKPLLEPGGWDSSDVLNPSVTLFHGLYYNLYSGFDGKIWHTGLAVSHDGIAWQKLGKTISPDPAGWEGDYIAANGSALAVDGELWYWYQAGARDHPRIGLARSAEGKTWRKESAPVLELGPYLSWDEEAVADPFVLRKDGWFYLYYLGQNRARQQQLGLARSRNGIKWEKMRGNPVIAIPPPGAGDPAENGLGEPAVWEKGSAYWMLLTGRDVHENRSLRLLRSGDGVHWTLLGSPIRGTEAWNAKVLCDATVLGDRFWFGGGDVASPDEKLHGRIGAGHIE